MIVKLLTKHHLKFLSLKGGCRGSSESTHVKMSHCWKSHALAQIVFPYSSSWSVLNKLSLKPCVSLVVLPPISRDSSSSWALALGSGG